MVKFAQRVRGIEISGIRRLFESAGADSINLGLGQPDFDTPQHIKDAAIKAILEGKTGYTNNTGIPELRNAICTKLKNENGLSCHPDQLIVTAGASEALHIVMQAMVDEGDRVLCPDPVLSRMHLLLPWQAGTRSVCRSQKTFTLMWRRLRR